MNLMNEFAEPAASKSISVSDPGVGGIRVKDLCDRDRRRLLMHFLELDDHGKLLRFGQASEDESITRYVQRMNLGHGAVFGIYNDKHNLIGVGHLAFVSREALPAAASITCNQRVAEFGISVSPAARGAGIGTKLFNRAATHCRNAGIDVVYMHCPPSDLMLAHIASKAGMQPCTTEDNGGLYLKLFPVRFTGNRCDE